MPRNRTELRLDPNSEPKGLYRRGGLALCQSRGAADRQARDHERANQAEASAGQLYFSMSFSSNYTIHNKLLFIFRLSLVSQAHPALANQNHGGKGKAIAGRGWDIALRCPRRPTIFRGYPEKVPRCFQWSGTRYFPGRPPWVCFNPEGIGSFSPRLARLGEGLPWVSGIMHFNPEGGMALR